MQSNENNATFLRNTGVLHQKRDELIKFGSVTEISFRFGEKKNKSYKKVCGKGLFKIEKWYERRCSSIG